jgi:hypothetical protein
MLHGVIENVRLWEAICVGPPSPRVCRGLSFGARLKSIHLVVVVYASARKRPHVLDVSFLRVLLEQKFRLFHVCLSEFGLQDRKSPEARLGSRPIS